MTTFRALSPSARNTLWAVLALRHAQGIGPSRAAGLTRFFDSPLKAVEACLDRPSAWAESGVVSMAVARKFSSGTWREKAKEEWNAVREGGLSFFCWGDEEYPDTLRTLHNPPLLLYYKGDPGLLHGPAVAVVGSRRCTREGITISAHFSRDLARAGVAVISGMARGIDRAAHLAGMEGPGRSVAVLGTGIDVIYPQCNADLYALLSEKGLLISEFPPGAKAEPRHFPVRNRLISGLSQGVLVVQAAGRSGSLITAHLALEQNRDVFVVPGSPLDPKSEGCRTLIREGGKPVFNADDVLADLAPLLTLEARKALEKRHAEAARKKRAPARDPAKEPHDDDLATAVNHLPCAGLPWIAPEVPVSRPASAERTKPVPDRKRRGAGPAGKAGAPVSDEEKRILDELSTDPLHIDPLTRALDMDVAQLSGLLTLLEVRGLVRRAPGMYYSLPEE